MISLRRIAHLTTSLLLVLVGWGTAKAQQPAVYDLNLSIRPVDTMVIGHGTLTFAVSPASTDSVEVILNKTMGEFQLDAVAPREIAGHPNIRIQEQDNAQTSYFVRYGRHLPPGEKVTLRYAYRGGRLQAQQYLLDSTFFFAGGVATAWYPQLVETIAPGVEQLTDGVGTLTVTLPKPFVAVMACAKTTTRMDQDSSTFTFAVSEPSYFALFAGRYHTATLSGDLPVTAYLLTEHDGIDGYLHGCRSVVDVLAGEFGDYPYPDFSLIEFPDDVSEKLGIGGGSLAGGIMMPTTSLNTRFNLALFGHELAHQWWGNLIRNNGDSGNGMLDEAMAQYGSLLVVERLDGPEGAETYRRRGYPGYIPNQSGIGYLKVAAMGKDEPLSHLTSQSIHVLDDSKGFLVYNVLRNTIGKDKMRNTLRAIVARHAHGFITWQEFLDEIQKESRQDLQWFYSQWFDRKGAPEWHLEWSSAPGTVHGTITQASPLYRLTIEVEVKGTAGESLVRQVEVSDSATAFEFKVPFQPSSVTLDPHFEIPHWDKDYKEEAYALVQPSMMTSLRLARKFDEAKALYAKASLAAPEPDKYGVRFLLEYEIGRVLMMEDNPAEALPHFLAAVRSPSRRDELLAWAYLRVAQMAALVHDTTTLDWAVKATISADALLGGETGTRSIAESLLAKPSE